MVAEEEKKSNLTREGEAEKLFLPPLLWWRQ